MVRTKPPTEERMIHIDAGVDHDNSQPAAVQAGEHRIGMQRIQIDQIGRMIGLQRPVAHQLHLAG